MLTLVVSRTCSALKIKQLVENERNMKEPKRNKRKREK